jgi:hypothetical protein
VKIAVRLSERVLVFCGRIPVNSLKLDGDLRIFDQLIAWDPDASDVTMR